MAPPIIFLSAKTKHNIKRVLDLALKIYNQRQIKISDSALNKFLKRAIKAHRPSQSKLHGRPYLYDLTQVQINPPRFKIKISKNQQINPTYIRYLENALRKEFKLQGIPIKIDLTLIKK